MSNFCNSAMWTSVILALIGCHLLTVSALPTGAPDAACADMVPRHGTNTPQTSKSPYMVKATSLGGNRYQGAQVPL